jgi:hypothetical protein
MKTGTWTQVKTQIKSWDVDQLTALIKDLHALSVDNRAFLSAKVLGDGSNETVLEPYRQRIVTQFFPKRGFGKLKLGEARKGIREYKKATGNMDGTMDLMMTYLENGNAFTLEYGEIDGRFYDSLCSVMDELATLLKKEGPAAYANVRERLDELASEASGIGWGYGDHINDAIAELEGEFG